LPNWRGNDTNCRFFEDNIYLSFRIGALYSAYLSLSDISGHRKSFVKSEWAAAVKQFVINCSYLRNSQNSHSHGLKTHLNQILTNIVLPEMQQ